jgi:uncharacterized glyoxalase superfamily protein PhnB
MLTNRSIPHSTVIPVIPYPDLGAAVTWLCDVFGFTLRVRIGDHRAQLNVGDGAVVATEGGMEGPKDISVMVRVENVDAHHRRTVSRGARIVRPPADHPYGERQYTVEDLGGYSWTFSQSIEDVLPEEWGGVCGKLD